MHLILAACHTRPSPQAVPLANAFLAAVVAADPRLANTVSVTLRDHFLTEPPSAAADLIAADRPDMVGFSVYLWNRLWCRAVAAELKERFPSITVFAGGPEATADPSGVLGEAVYDFLVVGEGEGPLCELLQRTLAGGAFADLPGVATRTAGSVTFTPASAIAELDTIHSPLLGGFLPADVYSGFLWQLSRGCSFACDFCFDAKEGRGVRRFSLERVAQELEWLVQNRVQQVFVLDSTFNQEIKRAKKSCG